MDGHSAYGNTNIWSTYWDRQEDYTADRGVGYFHGQPMRDGMRGFHPRITPTLMRRGRAVSYPWHPGFEVFADGRPWYNAFFPNIDVYANSGQILAPTTTWGRY